MQKNNSNYFFRVTLTPPVIPAKAGIQEDFIKLIECYFSYFLNYRTQTIILLV